MLWRIIGNAAWADHYFRPQGTQQITFFLADFIGHNKQATIAFDRSSNRKTGPCISTGWFNNSTTRLKQTSTLACLNHLDANAVFHAPARVEHFTFAQHQRRQMGRDTLQAYQGSMPSFL